MKKLTEFELKNLSFPDCIVQDMWINVSDKVAEVKTDTGYLLFDGGTRLKNCHLIIHDWEELQISRYWANKKKWEKLNVEDVERLVDICEFVYGKNVVFRGFGEKTGQWVEIKFFNCVLVVECSQQGSTYEAK
jgi:hypothetical protein